MEGCAAWDVRNNGSKASGLRRGDSSGLIGVCGATQTNFSLYNFKALCFAGCFLWSHADQVPLYNFGFEIGSHAHQLTLTFIGLGPKSDDAVGQHLRQRPAGSSRDECAAAVWVAGWLGVALHTLGYRDSLQVPYKCCTLSVQVAGWLGAQSLLAG